MTRQEARHDNVEYLLSSGDECLASAASELAAGRLRFAMNRVYYACFYAVSAVLLNEGRHFVKHTAVRSALHEHLVKTGRLTAENGCLYDELFKNRHKADYGSFVRFEAAAVQSAIEQATSFVAEMKRTLGR